MVPFKSMGEINEDYNQARANRQPPARKVELSLKEHEVKRSSVNEEEDLEERPHSPQMNTP